MILLYPKMWNPSHWWLNKVGLYGKMSTVVYVEEHAAEQNVLLWIFLQAVYVHVCLRTYGHICKNIKKN